MNGPPRLTTWQNGEVALQDNVNKGIMLATPFATQGCRWQTGKQYPCPTEDEEAW
jgi:hypothetical protein